jgi:hypothetical protein
MGQSGGDHQYDDPAKFLVFDGVDEFLGVESLVVRF